MRAFVPRSTTNRNPVDVNLSAALTSSTLGHPSGHPTVYLCAQRAREVDLSDGAHMCWQDCAKGSENSML